MMSTAWRNEVTSRCMPKLAELIRRSRLKAKPASFFNTSSSSSVLAWRRSKVMKLDQAGLARGQNFGFKYRRAGKPKALKELDPHLLQQLKLLNGLHFCGNELRRAVFLGVLNQHQPAGRVATRLNRA